jgi:NADH-quinone oxidoreductase subunit L
MIAVITLVGFLILLYSAEFMSGQEGFARYFAYMNLFIAAMVSIVLADDLLFLFLGWEGVGLCSYLLIGFWYKDPANVRAARKAFIVTRIGDAAFLFGIFLIINKLGTTNIPLLVQHAGQAWTPGSALPTAASALLLAGAVGKSAQLPLQVWLPDAMAGPSPVSALIHSATMVTAGVYLIARMNGLFLLAPAIMQLIAAIGAATLLAGGLAAFGQDNIKRVLAYSTISQIGYMFLALGIGAFTAAIFHFMVHAFFKSLLFLAAGVVIHSLYEEHDMYKMGGLHRELPWIFVAFFIGACSLSALPLVTAGFYSKDLILFHAWASPDGGRWLWFCGLIGAFLTALYTFRMVFLTFFGERRLRPTRKPGGLAAVPIAILSVLALVAGFFEMPPGIGPIHRISDILVNVFPPATTLFVNYRTQIGLQIAAAAMSLGGIVFAWIVYVRRPGAVRNWENSPAGQGAGEMLRAGLGLDRLYEVLIINPFTRLAHDSARDTVIAYVNVAARCSEMLNAALTSLQTGNVRWYAAGIGIGAAVIIAFGVLA